MKFQQLQRSKKLHKHNKQKLYNHQLLVNHLGKSNSLMVPVLPVPNSQDHKPMVSVLLIFAQEMNSFMSGDIASHAQRVDYMTELEEDVKPKVDFFLPTSSQFNVKNVNIDQLMVLLVMIAQTTLELKIIMLDAVEMNVKSLKSKMSMELAHPAQKVEDQISRKETVLKSYLT